MFMSALSLEFEAKQCSLPYLQFFEFYPTKDTLLQQQNKPVFLNAGYLICLVG